MCKELVFLKQQVPELFLFSPRMSIRARKEEGRGRPKDQKKEEVVVVGRKGKEGTYSIRITSSSFLFFFFLPLGKQRTSLPLLFSHT